MADRRDIDRDTTATGAAGAPPIGTAGAPLGSRAGAATSGTEGAYTGARTTDRTNAYAGAHDAKRGGMARWIWIALGAIVAILLLMWLFSGSDVETVAPEALEAPAVVDPVTPAPAD